MTFFCKTGQSLRMWMGPPKLLRRILVTRLIEGQEEGLNCANKRICYNKCSPLQNCHFSNLSWDWEFTLQIVTLQFTNNCQLHSQK